MLVGARRVTATCKQNSQYCVTTAAHPQSSTSSCARNKARMVYSDRPYKMAKYNGDATGDLIEAADG
eukprot:scaffold5237_cov179-Amphora_coffeaeformis.AAC.7